MKKYLIFALFVNCLVEVRSQKTSIDSSILGKWPKVSNVSISNNGNYALYISSNLLVGNNTLIIKGTHTNFKREFENVTRAEFTNDSKRVVFSKGSDSLEIIKLFENEEENISKIKTYSLPKIDNGKWLLCQMSEPENRLILRDLNLKIDRYFDSVENFIISNEGDHVFIEFKENKRHQKALKCLNLKNGLCETIWVGENLVNYSLDVAGKQIAFVASINVSGFISYELWYYKLGFQRAIEVAHGKILEIDSSLFMANDSPVFSKDGKHIFFKISESNVTLPSSNAVKVDIWNYKDKPLQSTQLYNLGPRSFTAVYNLMDKSIVQLEHEYEEILTKLSDCSCDFLLLCKNRGTGSEFWWNKDSLPSVYMLNVMDGSRQILKKNITFLPDWYFRFSPSPHGMWFVYFDNDSNAYFSYNIVKKKAYNITKNISFLVNNENYLDLPKIGSIYPVGIGGWVEQDTSILIYDDYDIWLVDLRGESKPINITNEYGRINHIKFRCIIDLGKNDDISIHSTLLLSAFNTINKYNGVYKKKIEKRGNPEMLNMGPYDLYHESSQVFNYNNNVSFRPLKAQDKNIWVVKKMSATEFPNYYITKDFRVFQSLSNLQPQVKYNWLTSELIRWKNSDSTWFTGILYKPENFDSCKKYPIIFNYYEKQSDKLFYYLEPDWCYGNINIPYFVSKGYLIFIPDIYYEIGKPGASSCKAITSAAQYLKSMRWIDPDKMGAQGQSFGGFETNYLVTHSDLFAAAAECAGPSNFISAYGELFGGGAAGQSYFEIFQLRMGCELWKNPDMYIENSPILKVDQVKTPFLIMHNKKDAVPWLQAVELFTALRRLGKKAWMLQYDEGYHGVIGKEAKDYTFRLTQFFDYYLMNAFPPKWMTQGIPASKKGIDDGFEIDKSGKTP